MDGLASLNDLHWYGTLATHWIASKKLLPLLDGYFFSPEYFHVGTDNELTARCQMAGKYTHAPDAIVIHQTPVQGDPGAEWDDVYRLAWRPDRVEQDRALLARRAKELGFEAWIK
jgi:GT2 family glycosyltransferase